MRAARIDTHAGPMGLGRAEVMGNGAFWFSQSSTRSIKLAVRWAFRWPVPSSPHEGSDSRGSVLCSDDCIWREISQIPFAPHFLAFSPSSLLERSRNTIPMVCVGLTAGARADIADVNIAEIDAPAVFAVQIRAAGQVRFGHHG